MEMNNEKLYNPDGAGARLQAGPEERSGSYASMVYRTAQFLEDGMVYRKGRGTAGISICMCYRHRLTCLAVSGGL